RRSEKRSAATGAAGDKASGRRPTSDIGYKNNRGDSQGADRVEFGVDTRDCSKGRSKFAKQLHQALEQPDLCQKFAGQRYGWEALWGSEYVRPLLRTGRSARL